MRLGEVSDYNLPDASRVDTMIGVGNNIPEPTHFTPGQARIPFFNLVGEVRRGLSNDFQRPFDRVSELPIVHKILQVVSLGEPPGVGHRLVNV